MERMMIDEIRDGMLGELEVNPKHPWSREFYLSEHAAPNSAECDVLDAIQMPNTVISSTISATQGKYLGRLWIYQNQWDAAYRLYDKFIAGKMPFLDALTQSGKTACLIAFSSLILDYCIENNIENPVILYVCMLSDTSLKDQASGDLEKAFENGYKKFTRRDLLGDKDFSDKDPIIRNLHHNDLKKFTPLPGETIFGIYDEIHERTNKVGLYEQHCKKIKNAKNEYHQIFSSATPFALEHLKEKYSDLQRVILPPGGDYYGIKDYAMDGRIRHAGKLFGLSGVSKFGEDFISDCVEKSETFGKSGYILIRDNGRSKNEVDYKSRLKRYVKEKYNLDCDVGFFDSDKGNIHKLESDPDPVPNKKSLLQTKPPCLTFIFIKASFRAGKRLSKEYIVGALDTEKSANTATVVQSLLGRLTGYNIGNKIFNIYCDTTHIDQYIRYWDGVITGSPILTIPSDANCKSNEKDITSKCSPISHSTFEAAAQRAKDIGLSGNASKKGGKIYKAKKVSDAIKRKTGKRSNAETFDYHIFSRTTDILNETHNFTNGSKKAPIAKLYKGTQEPLRNLTAILNGSKPDGKNSWNMPKGNSGYMIIRDLSDIRKKANNDEYRKYWSESRRKKYNNATLSGIEELQKMFNVQDNETIILKATRNEKQEKTTDYDNTTRAEKIDICWYIMNKRQPPGSSPIWCIDAPSPARISNGDCFDGDISWKKLADEYGGEDKIKGKYILFERGEKKVSERKILLPGSQFVSDSRTLADLS
jgi:hypothetical protein